MKNSITQHKKRPAAWAVGRFVFFMWQLRSQGGTAHAAFLYISLT